MKLNEAIDALNEIKRRAMTWNHQVILDEEDIEAIDTVIAELEKPVPSDEQIETWNAAIDAAADNAETLDIGIMTEEGWGPYEIVDKESILKLKR